MMNANIAIVGAGISGLSLAHQLSDCASITLFEKSRGVGGRMSTRYTDAFQFDHGAQFFTARSKHFKKFLVPFIENNIVNEWQPKVITLEKNKKPYKRLWYEPHYVASPKMNSLCKALAKAKNIELNTQICRLIDNEYRWVLLDSNQSQYGPFDWVISTAPVPQTRALLPDSFDDGVGRFNEIIMTGCFSMMLGINEALPFTWDAAKVKHSLIDWIAVDSTKPHRSNKYCLIIQSTNIWAEKHIEADKNHVRQMMREEVETVLNVSLRDVAYEELHRWRYANTLIDEDSEEEKQGYHIDENLKLATCGDWCLKGNVESAFLSARRLALSLKKLL